MIPIFKKLSESQKRDLDYYIREVQKDRDFYAERLKTTKVHMWDRDVVEKTAILLAHVTDAIYESLSVEEWYWLWDTHGKFTWCRNEMALCVLIMHQKEMTNLTIKIWVESCLENVLEPWEVYYYDDILPWMLKSFRNQLEAVGWRTIDKIHTWPKTNIWVPPWYLEFDPAI